MGKKLITIGFLIFIGSLITGLVFGNIVIISSVNDKAKAKFERRDELIFLNGTVSEIQYDFDEALWITINGSKLYNLYIVFRANDYIEKDTADNLISDAYYLMDVNDTITIYVSGRTLIDNLTFIKTAWDDLEGLSMVLGMSLTVMGCLGSLAIIGLLIAGICRIDDMDIRGKGYYKQKLEKKEKYMKTLEVKITNQKKIIKALSIGSYKPENLNIQYCHECGSDAKGNHCNYCGAEVRK